MSGPLLWAASTALALLLLVVIGVAAQRVGEARDRRRIPLPGQLFDVGGHRLHASIAGGGPITVVFDAALGGSSLSWQAIAPVVAQRARTVAYDRAGQGWSDPGPRPRTAEVIAGELRALLAAAQIPPPYLLVGHSFGGLVARVFAARHAEEIAGMVLVDPAHPVDLLTDRQRGRVRGGAWLSRRGAMAARLGIARAVAWLATHGAARLARASVFFVSSGALRGGGASLVAPMALVPRELHPALRSFYVRASFFEALAEQLEGLEATIEQVQAAGDLGDVPLVIVSAPNTAELNRRAASELSSFGRCEVVEGVGHWIQLERPDAIVAAVDEVLGVIHATE